MHTCMYTQLGCVVRSLAVTESGSASESAADAQKKESVCEQPAEYSMHVSFRAHLAGHNCILKICQYSSLVFASRVLSGVADFPQKPFLVRKPILRNASAFRGPVTTTIPPILGWHDLSNATCLMRPHLFSTALLV